MPLSHALPQPHQPGPRTNGRCGRLARTATGLITALGLLTGIPATAHALTPTTATVTGALAATITTSGNSAYVTSVYNHLFGRTPDAGGLAGWTTALAGTTPRVAVANAITASGEYRAGLITSSYTKYLTRTPDAKGLSNWLAAMNAGMTIQSMQGGFIASPEYYNRAGGTDAAWVTRLYADVLGRTPGTAEVTGWTTQLQHGTSRLSIAMGFLLSSEHLATVIDAQYQHLLGRSIDPSGRTSWVTAIQRGTRLETVIGGIIASTEYYNRVNPPSTIAAATAVPAKASSSGPSTTSTSSASTTPVAPESTTAAPSPAVPAGSVQPGPTNTGVPTGTKLTVHNGDLVVSTPGAVIDAMDIRGLVVVKAANVTIKRSIIRGRPVTSNTSLISNSRGAYPFTLEDSELAATHPSPYINGIIGANFTVKRANIHGVIDQIHLTGGNVTVESSWLHDNLHFTVDPNHKDGSHDDSIQVQGGRNITITGNTISGAYNAAIQFTQDISLVSDVRVTKNWLNGGGCTINVAEKGKGPLQNLTITDNTFGRDTRHTSCAIISPVTTVIDAQRNLYTDGQTATVRKG